MSVKSDTMLLHSSIKSARQLQQSQISKLHHKSEDEAQLFECFREYSKRRADIEQEYGQKLEKLAKSLSHKRAKDNAGLGGVTRRASVSKDKLSSLAVNSPAVSSSTLTSPSSPGEGGDSTSTLPSPTAAAAATAASSRKQSLALQCLLVETERQAKVRMAISEKFASDFNDTIKEFNKEKNTSFKKHSEHLQLMQEELWRSYAELEKARKAYEEVEKEAESAKLKYDDDVKRPNSTLKTLTNIVKQRDAVKHSANLKRKWNGAVNRLDTARNEYLLQLDAANAQQSRYYTVDLPAIMKRIDGAYYPTFADLLRRVVNMETDYSKTLSEGTGNILSAAERIQRDEEAEAFLADQKAVFGKPKPFNFDAVGEDATKDLVIDDFCKVILAQKLGRLVARHNEISRDLAKKQKERSSLRQMTDVYKSSPEFGNSSNPNDQLLELDNCCDFIKSEMDRLEVQIDRIKQHGIEPKMPEGQLEQSANASALYDYEPLAEGEVPLAQGDWVTVLEPASGGWIKVDNAGNVGLVPSNYLQINGAAPIKKQRASTADHAHASTTHLTASGNNLTALGEQARAIYDYTAKDPSSGELTFLTGDIIDLHSREITVADSDTEWWSGKCLRTGATGRFPAMFVEPTNSSSSSAGAAAAATTLSASSLSPLPQAPPTTAATTAKDQPPAAGSPSSESAPSKPGVEAGHVAVAAPPLAGAQPNSATLVYKALYDYDASCDGELTFRRDDLIEVLDSSLSDDWWEGKNRTSGMTGQFPVAYVVKASEGESQERQQQEAQEEQHEHEHEQKAADTHEEAPSSGVAGTFIGEVKALYDYNGTTDSELTFRTGDTINVVSRTVDGDDSGGWWLGEKDGRVGQIPASYVA